MLSKSQWIKQRKSLKMYQWKWAIIDVPETNHNFDPCTNTTKCSGKPLTYKAIHTSLCLFLASYSRDINTYRIKAFCFPFHVFSLQPWNKKRQVMSKFIQQKTLPLEAKQQNWIWLYSFLSRSFISIFFFICTLMLMTTGSCSWQFLEFSFPVKKRRKIYRPYKEIKWEKLRN